MPTAKSGFGCQKKVWHFGCQKKVWHNPCQKLKIGMIVPDCCSATCCNRHILTQTPHMQTIPKPMSLSPPPLPIPPPPPRLETAVVGAPTPPKTTTTRDDCAEAPDRAAR
jgi:hypothetical protein